jgi:hypothetical protein
MCDVASATVMMNMRYPANRHERDEVDGLSGACLPATFVDPGCAQKRMIVATSQAREGHGKGTALTAEVVKQHQLEPTQTRFFEQDTSANAEGSR